jgi:hypothetical protein
VDEEDGEAEERGHDDAPAEGALHAAEHRAARAAGARGIRKVISLVRTTRPKERTAKNTSTHLKAAPTSADA